MVNGSRRKNGSVGGGGGGCGGGTGKTCFPQLDKTLHQVSFVKEAINFSGKYKHKKIVYKYKSNILCLSFLKEAKQEQNGRKQKQI